MRKYTAITVAMGAMVWLAGVFATPANAQIVSMLDPGGRKMFTNAEPPNFSRPTLSARLSATTRPRNIYMTSEIEFMGRARPESSIDRDGAEKLVREAALRHNVDPALIRAVIQTESNWNSAAISRKGAGGLMQLIPTTAQRFGVNNLMDPQQNIDGGVRYLKTLLERYNGNLDLALAAYNAGEGAVDRAHGVPSFRETRDYVQKVHLAYGQPGSGRQSQPLLQARPIHRNVGADGRLVFTNE